MKIIAMIAAAIAVLAASALNAADFNNAPMSTNVEDRRGDPAEIRAHDYRMWAAEQMINRITEKMVRAHKMCDQAEWIIGQRLSEKCITNVLSTYPVLGKIRQVAAGGDRKQWLDLIDAVHQFEADIDGPLNDWERRWR